jgi:hypothetical protein
MNIDALVCDVCGTEACWNGTLLCDGSIGGVTSRRAWLLSTCPAHATDGMTAAVRNNRRLLGLPPQDCTCAEARVLVTDT